VQINNLRVDESALTGESVPVEKALAAVAADAALGDRLCMGYAGTLVTQGQARGVVVATGSATEMGRIGRLLESVEQVTTPLVRNMGQLARWITWRWWLRPRRCSLSAPGARHAGGRDVHDRRGLAVAAIPEGCPPSCPSPWPSACSAWPRATR
jgi:hypothetical protein